MSDDLNIGKGRCHGTARLLIKPVRAVIELGALQDVLSSTLNCVHHANRTGSIDDFIAVALPQMHKGREVMRLGHEIELIGSEDSLSRLEGMDGLATLRRRGMIEAIEIGETWIDPGATGAAYVRDRSNEKYTPGWVRRTAARAERRGKPVGKRLKPMRKPDNSTLALFYGDAVLHIQEVVAPVSEAPLIVSTYGFSSSVAPAILPVMPDSARLAGDAA
ncbi:type I-F CRISPR-associated endoribonuclease Cas6/Csy4 [Phaeovulum sp. NW3]|uniref:type I-F CRISPR-associated endoribonuclease Cas6/Csy4 n=1 Tax=Phaeovulum sp. NW3 TaxID=2934933 RepID=UPI00202225E4|nr:type I-F CRISPR-associated endoribonuclease Cas6/Csy4 [Phaeovulum sp. NW3]MCL7466254.1 type I-F CRISPR-associated endoribonuclease Cas6/Csy4 [Phaeovulum sp. NW3]